MATVNQTNYNQDLTVRVFDRFYKYDASVPSNEWDLVYTYFRSVMTTDRIAQNFATSLFMVSNDTGIPVMTLLQGFQGQTGVNLTVNLAYYLNLIRSRATLLGVSSATTPNYYAARAVLQ